MSASYADRVPATHIDGTPIFQTAEDRAAEAAVADELAKAWRCQIGSFGILAPIDWYANRDGRLVGLLELKARTHPSDRFPTVFLNLRKYLALMLAGVGIGVPALYVVRFTDGIRWTGVNDIDIRGAVIAGCARRVKSVTDVEPVIEVPVSTMKVMA